MTPGRLRGDLLHALHQGVKHSTGEWILFMDADVHMEPGTLARVVGWCDARGIDHASMLPRLVPSSFGLGVMYAYILRVMAAGAPIPLVESPKTKTAAGGGMKSTNKDIADTLHELRTDPAIEEHDTAAVALLA